MLPSPPKDRGDLLLLLEPGGFRHRGIDLSHVVEGLSELKLEEGFQLHPDDISALGLKPGEELTLSWNGAEATAPVRPDPDLPRGAATAFRPLAYGGLLHRRGLLPLFRQQANVLSVRVVSLEHGKGRGGEAPPPVKKKKGSDKK